VRLIDVTDLVEFLQRGESVSGVQRVVAEVAPLIADTTPVVLDRGRGVFVALTPEERFQVIENGARSSSSSDRTTLAYQGSIILARAKSAAPIGIDQSTMLIFLGALWISDALMLAARHAHGQGAKLLILLYDLTPVLDAHHTAGVNRLFERYLNIAGILASQVPAISQSSRQDFQKYCQLHGWSTPPGSATGLPPGVTPQQTTEWKSHESESPWPRSYALFVGTIEGRKNHKMALRAWQKLDRPPDLVCVGRLGWNANEFLDEYMTTKGNNGTVSILTSGVTDQQLRDFYQHADFTIYPSSYEGWGLPVSESLAFGKVTVVADNSSLREAGGDLADYFESGNLDNFVEVLSNRALDPDQRANRERHIKNNPPQRVTWQHVADTIQRDINAAQRQKARVIMPPEIEIGHEYVIAISQAAPSSAYADKYLDHVVRENFSPLLQQPRKAEDLAVIDSALSGQFGSPQTWGYELHPGKTITFRITRPVAGELTVHFATRSMPGVITVDSTGPGGPQRQDIYAGSVLSLPLGDGEVGEPAQVIFHVTDATDSIEGFLGIRSFVVLSSLDVQAEILVHKSAAQALRQELDFLTNTRSWKVTAPLRKWKGRGTINGH
jgi:glycosyltransferase involved in cell wall biosynthesis